MATIVIHRPTGRRYALLGAGYGAWASARPNMLLGDIFPKEQSGEAYLVALSDENGQIGWLRSSEL